MPRKYIKKRKFVKKRVYRKRRVYSKPKMKIYKVPKMKTIALKREQWIDMNFASPGGMNWTVDGRVNPTIVDEQPVLNMKVNTVLGEGDPAYSRITWQPIFTLAQLPDLSDVSGMFRLFKINKISITLYPMRATNPNQNMNSQVSSPNLIVNTLYAKSGLDNRIGMGTDSLAQVQNKTTKLYNLGIGTKKLGWYFKPYSQDITYKNPTSTTVPVTDGHVNIASCFTNTVRRPGYQDIEEGKYTEHFGPLMSFRSVDGSNLAGGTAIDNNFKFRICVKYYFTLKGTH